MSPTARLRAVASATAPSSTAAVLRLSTGIDSTAKTFVPFSEEAVCFSASAVREHEGDDVRGLGIDALDLGAQVVDVPRVHREELNLARAGDLLERRRHGVDRAYGCGTRQRFADLQQKVITRRDGDDLGCSTCR